MGSRPIQTQPRGLLGLLQLKNQGQNPAELLDSVSPVLDIERLLVGSQLELVSTALTPAALSSNVGLTVPETEVWFVWGCCVTTDVLGVGDVISLAPTIAPSSSALIAFPVGPYVDGVAADFVRAASYPGILIAEPGAIIGSFVKTLAGAVQISTAAVIARARA